MKKNVLDNSVRKLRKFKFKMLINNNLKIKCRTVKDNSLEKRLIRKWTKLLMKECKMSMLRKLSLIR